MDVNRVTPLQGITIFSLFIGLLVFWFWANGRALDYMGPAHLHTDRHGSLYIQIGNHLIEHDADGKFVTDHDLTALGIEKFLGDFAFFNNGDILLAKRQQLPTTDENLSAYQREKNQRPVNSDEPGDGLFRCSLDSQTCERLGEKALDFGRAFHLFIAPGDEAVYVADSSRHALRKYSRNGEELASRESGFIFPNQILIVDDKLYVTDTNHHSIHIVKPGTEKFAQSIEMIDVRHPVAKKTRNVWPSSLLKVGTNWWVNNMGSGMSHGSVDIFDENWNFSKSLKLPDDADPQSIIHFNGNILVSDFSLHRIYQFDQNGGALDDFQSSELEQILNVQAGQHQFYKNLQTGGLVVFGLCFALGLLLIIWQELHKPENVQSPSFEEKLANINDHEIQWIRPDTKFVDSARSYMLALIALSVFGIILIFPILKDSAAIPLIIFLVVIPLLIIYWGWTALKSRIGIHGEILILQDYHGRHAAGHGKRIRYSELFLLIDNIAIALGKDHKKIFSTQDLMQHVYPLLKHATYVSNGQMTILLLKRRHLSIVMTWGIIGIAVITMITMMIFG